MEQKQKNQSKQVNQKKKSFIVLTGLFFIWGFIISMNDILIPYFKAIFELSYFQAMLVQFAFFGSFFIGSLVYFILSVKTGDPIAKIGYRNGMAGGLFLAGLGCLLFYPATSLHSYGFFLGALFCLGLGIICLSNGIYITGIFTLLILLNLLAFRIGHSLPGRTVGIFSLNIIILLVIAFFTKGQLAMWSIIGIGLFASIMWSNIFTLAIRGLGKYTSQGSSLLIMAILGAALIPPIQGIVADTFGIQHSFIVILACHLFVAWYGLKGCKKMK